MLGKKCFLFFLDICSRLDTFVQEIHFWATNALQDKVWAQFLRSSVPELYSGKTGLCHPTLSYTIMPKAPSNMQQVAHFQCNAVKRVMFEVTVLDSVLLFIHLLKAQNCHKHLPCMQYNLIACLFWMLSFMMPRGRFSPGKHFLLV